MTRLSMSRRARRSVALGLAAIAVPVLLGLPASGSDVTGDAGVDTSLPLTDSAVKVKGRGKYAGLEITVNQTKELLNQAVSITWTGGKPTNVAGVGGRFGTDYLQIMQCWGDDDGTNPANPGPPPEKCAFGATNGVFGGVSGRPFPPSSLADTRIISRKSWPNYDPKIGTLADPPGNVWRDFVAVDGTRVGNHFDPNFDPEKSGVFWQNPFFNVITTNEIPGGTTLNNGEGAELMEVVTGVENSGLGCGQRVLPLPDGSKGIPTCWIVIVPRSDAATENVGTAGLGVADGVGTSPLAPAAWANRIAIPVEFNPVDTACALGEDATRIAGSELALPAVANWQPTLCAIPDQRPFAFGIVSDASARQQLVNRPAGAAGMYVTSRPVAADLVDPLNPTVYAPLTLSGLTVGFNIDRLPALQADDEARALRGVRVAELNLTPRLLAKLLTQSYTSQVSIKVAPDYAWMEANPGHLGVDEDFLRFNPEFRELEPIFRKEFSGLLIPAGNSDAARQLWTYVLADPEAKTWLDGAPDEWGMKVNPVYATKADANSQGAAFAVEPPDNFPKSDPYCYQAPKTGLNITPPLLCGTDWNPFTQLLRDGARLTRAATDGARLEENTFANSPDRFYTRTPPQTPGGRSIMSVTDTASARLFGLQMARLSRAGDGGAEREFIAPTTDGLVKAVQAMKPSSDAAVLESDPLAEGPGAYPLTLLTYATIRPLDLTSEERKDYAVFVDYAATAGQVSGQSYGKLPFGYAPLTEALASQARAAAKTIRELQPPASTPDTATTVPASASFDTGGSTTASFGRPSFSGGTTGGVANPTPIVPAAPDVADEEAVTEVELVRTPGVSVPGSRFVVPVVLALAVLCGLGAFQMTKRSGGRP